MLTADKSKEYCCNSPAKEEEHTRSSNVFICGPSPEDFVAVITPQAFQIHIFVSIPPPVRSVIVITNLQFGKRTLPFSCNLSITATRYLSFRKVPPGSYHLNLNFIVGFTRPDILNDVYYFENRTQTKYFVAKKKKNHLISNFVAAAPCNYHSHERIQFLSDKQFCNLVFWLY